ncbi:MAG: hypothetical protein GYA73_11870 [Planctomycetes bacterium]|nr:hypothetical protein [Planctomycetota bacterium]
MSQLEEALTKEHDPRVKQPIAYTIVCHRPSARVFAYRRASEAGKYDEARLRGKWSWGVGGHIERSDGAAANPIRASLERELAEEISIDGPFSLRVLGYINDDATDVGRVHFGILYLAEIAVRAVVPRAPEIAHGSLRELAELEAIARAPDAAVEDWSRIAWEPLKAALGAPAGA